MYCVRMKILQTGQYSLIIVYIVFIYFPNKQPRHQIYMYYFIYLYLSYHLPYHLPYLLNFSLTVLSKPLLADISIQITCRYSQTRTYHTKFCRQPGSFCGQIRKNVNNNRLLNTLLLRTELTWLICTKQLHFLYVQRWQSMYREKK